jgi:hypothetical protein
MEWQQLEALMVELERLDSRDRVRKRVEALEPNSTKEPLTPLFRFTRYIAKPYMAGVSGPLFSSEFPAHWPRFKALGMV